MKKKNRIIRSSKLSVKFSNVGKIEQLSLLVDEYKRVLDRFIDILWDVEDAPSLLPKEITSKVETWLSARMVQCIGKQASAIVRGTKTKQKRRLWKINDFIKRGMYKKARKLQKTYDENKISKPNVTSIACELDERFIIQDFNNPTTFDGWIKFWCIGNKMKLSIPVKQTKHFNEMLESGQKLLGIRLSKKDITFNFELEKVEKKTNGSILGIDIGKKTAISCSNGVYSKENKHGQTLDSIIDKMSKKKKGSKAFGRTQKHRKNYINWCINNLDLEEYKQINIERIKYLRKGKRTNRKLQGWTYTEIFSKLKDKCVKLGVQVHELNPTYTSQRCSVCGWVRKNNRKGKLFKCTSCGHTQDADLNASLNLSFNLTAISSKERLKKNNRTGFYWISENQENIIPDTLKTNF